MIYAVRTTFKNSQFLSFLIFSIIYFFNNGHMFSDYIIPYLMLSIGSFLCIWIYESEENEIITYDTKTKRKQKRNYKHGLLNGCFMEWHKNGNLYLKHHYVLGKLNGPAIQCDYKGKLRVQSFFKNDKLDGKSTRWVPNGFKIVDTYKDDKKNGLSIWYGIKEEKYTFNYINDKLEGWSTFISSSFDITMWQDAIKKGFNPKDIPKLQSESFYKNDKLNGLSIRYIGFRHFDISLMKNGETIRLNNGGFCFQEFYREDRDSKKYREFRNTLKTYGLSQTQLYKYDSVLEYDKMLRKKYPHITNYEFKKMIKQLSFTSIIPEKYSN